VAGDAHRVAARKHANVIRNPADHGPSGISCRAR
jgi:hypothetical protein